MKVWLKHVADWTEDILLLSVAGDILYLYYAGAWQEPIRAVELTELGILWAIIPFALWRFIKHVKEVSYEQSNKG